MLWMSSSLVLMVVSPLYCVRFDSADTPISGLMYCMEYLEKNIDWLFEEMEKHPGTALVVSTKVKPDFVRLCTEHYFLFDCPGQVELYTHHESMRNIVDQLQKKGYRVRLGAVIIQSQLMWLWSVIAVCDSFGG